MVVVCSAGLSVICAFVGIVISTLADTPVGSTIVAVDVAAFAICYFCRIHNWNSEKIAISIPEGELLQLSYGMRGYVDHLF